MKFNKALTLGLVGMALAAPSVMAEGKHQHDEAAHHEAHAGNMLKEYAAVSAALYADDLDAAKEAAADMVDHDGKSAMTKHAQAIANSKTLEDARMHFKELSDIAIPIATKEKSMHVAHCPMANGGKGADWLQASDGEIQNPYYGAKMAHCGKFVK